MDIRVKTTGLELSPESRQYLHRRIESLEKLLSEVVSLTRCEVEVGKDAGRPRHGANMWFAEIHLKFPGGSVYARNNSESVNGAIDDVKEEAERQLRKTKRLHTRMLRKGGAIVKRILRRGDK